MMPVRFAGRHLRFCGTLAGQEKQAEEAALDRSAVEGEVERLRGEIRDAIKSVKRLYDRIMASADPETTLANVVEDNVRLLLLRGLAMNRRNGTSIADFLSEFTVQGLIPDENGRMVTPAMTKMSMKSE